MITLQLLLENIKPKSPETHITHFEDTVFYGGPLGVFKALKMAQRFVERPEDLQLSAKYDGSPSVFFGPAPVSGNFFVATKSIFNKKPQLFYSVKEIQENLDGDLSKKMTYAFHFLQKLKPRHIMQGDLLYVKGGAKRKKINGSDYITFHPNTLYYAVKESSPEGDKVKKSQLGIALHTKWYGDTTENLKPVFNIDESDYEDTSHVFVLNPYREVEINRSKYSSIEKLIQKIKSNVKKNQSILKKASEQKTSALLERFHNHMIKKKMHDVSKERYITLQSNFFKSKGVKIPLNENECSLLYDIHLAMTKLKNLLLSSLETNDDIQAFVKEKTGTTLETDIEGFVISLGKNSSPLKLVDRPEFAAFNFDTENIKRGWKKK